jgi:hypothetical protein
MDPCSATMRGQSSRPDRLGSGEQEMRCHNGSTARQFLVRCAPAAGLFKIRRSFTAQGYIAVFISLEGSWGTPSSAGENSMSMSTPGMAQDSG